MFRGKLQRFGGQLRFNFSNPGQFMEANLNVRVNTRVMSNKIPKPLQMRHTLCQKINAYFLTGQDQGTLEQYWNGF